MKILAVIPARAGSKGIPNKNIRIIGGHPLIYYSINNALQSKYISDIIVTTDSSEIQIVSTQMGVKYKLRRQELCGDAVTLDAVIADAIPDNEEWDYIITMQPTSPTLSVQTLDRAIKYAIDCKLDTLISAINAPHLSWSEKEGNKVPNYQKRLNRQYLPPHYKETGAFMISRASVITPETRIGKRVDVFEIPENEAIDIDNFYDLQNAAMILDKKKVAIYVNGNNQRGIGHIYRALEIADEFYIKPDIYFDKNQTDIDLFGKTTHTLIPINGIIELFECCKRAKYDIFINDILSTSIDYMIGLRTILPKAKIINFEDDGEGILRADLVFNALYQKTNLAQVYSGEKYYISGKLFMFYEPIYIKPKVENIFISFGGADPQDYTQRLLNIVTKENFKTYRFIVVVGRAYKYIQKAMEYNKYSNIDVFYDVSNMPELMSQCDIAITSRGRTGYEVALLGIPTIAMAQNQREEKHGFVSAEHGFNYLGLNPRDTYIESNLKLYLNLSQEDRIEMQKKLLSYDLKSGRRRVMSLINSL